MIAAEGQDAWSLRLGRIGRGPAGDDLREFVPRCKFRVLVVLGAETEARALTLCALSSCLNATVLSSQVNRASPQSTIVAQELRGFLPGI